MMLHNAIEIAAPPQTIYRYASATERWPQFLPHYRSVRVVQGDDRERIVDMSAWRSFIPVRWRAEQRNDRELPRIEFRHIAGPARGMVVEWRFEPVDGRTRVVIDHQLKLGWPQPLRAIGEFVIGRIFIYNIANKTLARMKLLAESEGHG
jgi:uncharacterized membrane protein